jgi:hypothetical protein
MRMYMFKSQTRKALRAFVAELDGGKLPSQHGTVVGVVGEAKDPPYNLPRAAIEAAIDAQGFQLFRLVTKSANLV